ncbi:M20 family metallopeptidase [uncultured Phascolarctobacterium sp.]|uniref:M20 family metallopeptidase n=1 Tax=Phascolarctobacterium sp. TaxID=2049039 RepID=UPI0025D98B38|nr:M20 family metallopeptidase [uncultured Phascolarctobacterium sp.]
MKTKILEQLRTSEAEMLQFLEQLVNIDSGADALDGINQVADKIGAFLAPLGFDVQYLETTGAPVQLLARRARAGKKQVLFSGHMDTVFTKGTTAARPLKIEDGRAYGPGVLDMKGGLVMALQVIKAMVANGWEETDLTVLLCGDEEMSHPLTDAVNQFKKAGAGKDAVFNLEFGRIDGSVVTGRKGTTRPTLVVEGIAAHAGNEPEKGASAILELAQKTVAIHALNNFELGTTYNVGVFSGGTMANIVADKAVGEVDVRFKTIAEAEKSIADMQRIVATNYVPHTKTTVTGNVIKFMPFETTPAVQKLYEHYASQAAGLGLAKPGQQYVGGASDAAWPAMTGAPTLCGVGPCGAGAHSDSEYIEVATLTERALLMASCIMDLDRL